jgi:hypothetical protein
MPIDFPANPTNGQVFSNWIYDGTITAWRNVNTDTGVAALNTMGLRNVVPTSVTVASGSATTNANGLVTFSGATGISLNGVFTGTYRNYKIVAKYRNSTNSNTSATYMRMRASGSDLTSADWVFGGSNTTTISSGSVSIGSWGSWGVSLCHFGYFTPNFSQASMEITEPNIAAPTGVLINSSALNTSTSAHYSTSFNGGFNSNSVADGFTIYSENTNALSGTIQVFGYTN